MLPLQVFDGDHAVVTVTLDVAHDLSVVTVADTVAGLGTAEFAADRQPVNPPSSAGQGGVPSTACARVGPTTSGCAIPWDGPVAVTVETSRLVVYPRYEELEGLQ